MKKTNKLIIITTLMMLFSFQFASAAIPPTPLNDTDIPLLCGSGSNPSCGNTSWENFIENILPMILLGSFILMVVISAWVVSNMAKQKISWLLRALIIIFVVSVAAALIFKAF